jgi:hypothetical protein
LKKTTSRVIHILEFFTVISLVLLFILSSPKTLKFVVDSITDQLGLEYQQLDGNLLGDIHIQKLSFKDLVITQNSDLRLNIFHLFRWNIHIESVTLKDVDIDNLRRFISTFKLDSDNNSSAIFRPTISIHNISLDVLPYKRDELDIEKLKIFVEEVSYDSGLVIDNLRVDLNSSMFNMAYLGSLHKKNLIVDSMTIDRLDIQKILYLKGLVKSDSDSKDSIIDMLKIRNLELSTTPYQRGSYSVKSLLMSANNISTDFKNFDVESLDLDIDTNIWKLTSSGSIDDNLFNSDVKVDLDSGYFKRFISYVDYKSLNPVKVSLKIDQNSLRGSVDASSKSLLIEKYRDLDLKLLSLNTQAEFDFDSLKLHFFTDANLSSKYSDNIGLNGDFFYDRADGVRYNGIVDIEDFKNLYKNEPQLLRDIAINFDGNTKMVDLSYSGLLDIDGRYIFKDREYKFSADLPKKSLLQDIYKDIHLKKFFPQNITINKSSSDLYFNSSGSNLNIDGRYDFKSSLLDSNISVGSDMFRVFNRSNRLLVDLSSRSLKSTITNLQQFYNFSAPSVDGDVKILGEIKEDRVDFKLNSKWMLYEYEKYKFLFFENIDSNLSLYSDRLLINSYSFSSYIMDRYKTFYANRVSKLLFLEDGVKLDIIVDDQIRVNGMLDSNLSLNILADNYHLIQPDMDLNLSMDMNLISNSRGSILKGEVKLYSGTLGYRPRNTYLLEDDDIVFIHQKAVKEKLKKEQKSLDIDIKVVSLPLLYRYDKNSIKFTTKLKLSRQNRDDLKVFGDLNIIDGVYYSDKNLFSLGKGDILFDGDILNPYLDLKAYYQKEPYDITIFVGGQLKRPKLHFSSSDDLSQNDILSILLFNTKTSNSNFSSSGSSAALSLFGSRFAKGISDSLGIKLDRVNLITTSRGTIGVELEKKLSKKTTIIYQNDLVNTIKIKYQNREDIETNFTFSPDSTGVDLIFKNEK